MGINVDRDGNRCHEGRAVRSAQNGSASADRIAGDRPANSIFQTVTSIQEQTLTFVPKIVGMFLCLMLLGDWMLNNMTTYMTDLWQNFSVYIR